MFVPSLVKRFYEQTTGAVAVIVALTLPIMIGTGALAIEYGAGIMVRSENQRVSDAAAFAAAVAHARAPGDAADKWLAATHTAKHLGSLNGVDPGQLSLNLLNETDIEVTITEDTPLRLARVLDSREELSVVVRSVARIGDLAGPACVLSLSDSTFNGTPDVDLEGCTVGANGTITVNGQSQDFGCASPQANSPKCDWEPVPPFKDPIGLSWDDAQKLCTAAGRSSTTLDSKGNDLEAGPHCISGATKLTGKGETRAEGGVVLFFAPNASLDVGGNHMLDLAPVTDLDLGALGKPGETLNGVLFYGPEAALDLAGTSDTNISVGCFGIVMETIRMSGSPTISADCRPEDSGINNTNTSKPRLIR